VDSHVGPQYPHPLVAVASEHLLGEPGGADAPVGGDVELGSEPWGGCREAMQKSGEWGAGGDAGAGVHGSVPWGRLAGRPRPFGTSRRRAIGADLSMRLVTSPGRCRSRMRYRRRVLEGGWVVGQRTRRRHGPWPVRAGRTTPAEFRRPHSPPRSRGESPALELLVVVRRPGDRRVSALPDRGTECGSRWAASRCHPHRLSPLLTGRLVPPQLRDPIRRAPHHESVTAPVHRDLRVEPRPVCWRACPSMLARSSTMRSSYIRVRIKTTLPPSSHTSPRAAIRRRRRVLAPSMPPDRASCFTTRGDPTLAP
jgi:hypothetical protein